MLQHEYYNCAEVQADADQVKHVNDLLLGKAHFQKPVVNLGRIAYIDGFSAFNPFEYDKQVVKDRKPES
jgi:hypothetical protein